MFRNILKILLLSLIASFLPYMACELFDSNRPHGLLSFDFLLMVFSFCLKSERKTIRVICSFAALVYAVFGNSVDYYVVALFYLILLWVPFFTTRIVIRVLLFVAGALIILISDAGVFFYNTFAMSMAEAWGVSKFFWWGLVLFFTVPCFQILLELFFARDIIFGSKSVRITTVVAIATLVSVSCIHLISGLLQNRQPILEFGVKEYVWQITNPNVVGHNPMLQEDIKRSIPQMDLENLCVKESEKTVMILVESWGVNKDVEITKALLAPYETVENKTFLGIGLRRESFTQAAEYEDFHVDSVKTIPAYFKEQNFRTVYLHGYEGSFYKRSENYKKYGFDTLIFKEDFNRIKMENCKFGFSGICDSSIVGYIDSLLNDSVSRFIYWTTLDGHLPYEKQQLNEKSPQCSILQLGEVDCVYFTRQENTARYIAGLIKKHPNVNFIVKGDHRPPGSIVNPKFSSNYYYRWVPTVIVSGK